MEIPILFINRKFGKSKMSKRIFLEALINIWKIRKNVRKHVNIRQFFKFAITGGLGTFTNIAIFFILADKLLLHVIPVSIICFLIAVTQNYTINQKWSFRKEFDENKLSIKNWFYYVVSSLFGLSVNIIILQLLITSFELPYKFIAQLAGIAAGMFVNYFISKNFVFKR